MSRRLTIWPRRGRSRRRAHWKGRHGSRRLADDRCFHGMRRAQHVALRRTAVRRIRRRRRGEDDRAGERIGKVVMVRGALRMIDAFTVMPKWCGRMLTPGINGWRVSIAASASAAFFRVREGRGFFEGFLARADRLGEPVLIEFGRLRLPPARRDLFGGNGNHRVSAPFLFLDRHRNQSFDRGSHVHP